MGAQARYGYWEVKSFYQFNQKLLPQSLRYKELMELWFQKYFRSFHRKRNIIDVNNNMNSHVKIKAKGGVIEKDEIKTTKGSK